MTGRNVPAGWAAFRALRQTPAPHRAKRHGNWRHGGRSRWGVEQAREVRCLVRALDVLDGRRVGKLAPHFMGWLRPLRVAGWGGYRLRRRVRLNGMP